jgi:hypothetical protein
VQFIGDAKNKQPLELGLVSFKGVDLSNVEFHNVRWLKTKSLVARNKIIDEQLLDSGNANYEEMSKIYNQLRKKLRIQVVVQ